MNINGRTDDETIEITTVAETFARITMEADGQILSISLNSNHLQALEAAVKAARLELDARAVGP